MSRTAIKKEMTKKATGYIVTVPAGEYWLGDPCYTIQGESYRGWSEWLEAADFRNEDRNYDNLLLAEVGNTGLFAMAFSTAHGDGLFEALSEDDINFTHNLPVDAGLIGLVPVEVGTPDEGLAVRVKFDTDTVCTRDGGVLKFGPYIVDTNWD